MSKNSEISQPKISKFRKLMRIITAIGIWSFVSIILLMLSMFFWVYTGPRSVPMIANYTAETISDFLPKTSTLTREDFLVTIDDYNLVLKVKKPLIKDTSRGDFQVSEVDLRFDVVGLMPQSNRNILSVEISDPKLQLNKLLLTQDIDEEDQKLPIEQINTYLNAHKEQLVKFSLSLNNTKFSFNANEDRVVEVIINNLMLSPNIQNDKIVLSLYGDINIAGNSNIIDLTLDTSNIKYFEYSGSANNISTLLFESLGYPIKELAGSNLEVDISFKGHTNSLRSLDYSKFEISNFRGKIVKNHYFSSNIAPKSFVANGELFNNGEEINLNDMALVINDTIVTGSSSFKKKHLKANLLVSKISIDELSKYWANNLIPRTRNWIFESIKSGNINNSKVSLNLDFGDPEFPKNMNKDAYTIDTRVENAVFLLDKDFPEVSKIQADVVVNSQEVLVKAESAEVNNVKISNIDSKLDKLGHADSTLHLKAKANGKTNEVIDLAYLFSKQANDLFKDVKGSASADLNLNFKIFKEIKSINDLNLEVSADVKSFASEKLIKGYPVKNGSFKASYKNGVVSVNGSSSVKELEDININGNINIIDNSKSITAKRYMNFSDLKKIGITAPNFAKGNFNLIANIDQKANSSNMDLKFKVIIDESQLSFPQINIIGGAKSTGYLTIFASFKKDVFSINRFDVQLAQLKGSGAINLDSRNQISYLSSKNMKLGKGEFSLKYKGGPDTKLEINGPSFDYSALNIEQILGGDNSVSSNGPSVKADSIKSLNIGLSVDKIYMMQNEILYKPQLEFVSDKNMIKKLKLNAYTSSGSPVKVEYFSPRLVASFPDSGVILSSLGLYNNMLNGKMFISGNLENDTFHGDMIITDFRIKKAPILAKLLSLASVSLTSFSSLENIIGGKGIRFDKLIAKFNYKNRNIALEDLVLKGPSLALTGYGDINIETNFININGTVIPENILNKAVKAIPVINQLLGVNNKEEEALGVKFTVEGSLSDPKVNVNPLSILAPGFLKKIIGQ